MRLPERARERTPPVDTPPARLRERARERTLPVDTPPARNHSPPNNTLPETVPAPQHVQVISPPNVASPPKFVKVPKTVSLPKVSAPKASPPKVVSPPRSITPPPVLSPPVASPPKPIRVDARLSENDASPSIPADTDGSEDLPPPDLLESTEESNGVGDKIKIFEKAAEDAATAGRLSRPGSVRRARTERLPSDELPPPPAASPPRIVRPEFRLASPAEVTIRSPSLGAKAPERFPSRGTAFRNVTPAPPVDEDRKKDRQTRSNYFRGSEEIWLVKKKDIEEIEERVLDSFRRAANTKRAYARSESLEAARPEWRAQLKRQASVACTCGHDKKTRARSVDAARTRARSHAADEPAAVLDKYETLV